jgi:hypothetical protein
MVIDSVRVEAHAFDFRLGPATVSGIDDIIQHKSGPALGAVDLDWEHGRRPDEDSVGAFFSHNERPLFDAQAAPELRRQHDVPRRPTLLAAAFMSPE